MYTKAFHKNTSTDVISHFPETVSYILYPLVTAVHVLYCVGLFHVTVVRYTLGVCVCPSTDQFYTQGGGAGGGGGGKGLKGKTS